jgi:alkanesulfonate monooxygenase SsuD/methylene tetrahydromethanopterin reductase-like flavin-dependent oxidoreductase (luciferase family)
VEPYVLVCAMVIAADTQEQAERIRSYELLARAVGQPRINGAR